MRKYAHVQKVVTRLTEDEALRTFFTIYLMAESREERQRLNDRFHASSALLSPSEKELLKAEMTRCFLRLPTMAAELVEKVVPLAN